MKPFARRQSTLDVLAAAAVIGAATAVCLPFLRSGDRILLNDDWLQLASRHALLRRSFLRGGELPLRTPFLAGGYPSFGDPEDPALDPLAVLTAAFGEVRGLKLIAFFLYATGGVGMLYLTRIALGMNLPPALYAALVFGLSGWSCTRHASGNVNELWALAAPLLFGLLLHSARRRGAIVAFGAVSAAMLTDGKLIGPSVMLLLGLFAVAAGARMRKWQIEWNLNLFANLVRGGAIAMLLCAPKIAAVFDLFQQSGSALSPQLTYHAPGYIPAAIGTYNLHELAAALLRMPSETTRDASGRLFVGPVGLLLFAVGVVCCFRRVWRWLLVLVVALWLAFGANAPVDLFRLLYLLPVFKSMSQPFKYFDIFVPLTIAVVGGYAFDLLHRRLGGRWFAVVGSVIVLSAVGPMVVSEVHLHGAIFDAKAPRPEPSPAFYQIRGIRIRSDAPRPPLANMYFNVLRNVGTQDAFLPVHIPSRAQPRFFIDEWNRATKNSQYRGEAHFVLGPANSVESMHFRANSIRLSVALSQPDTLVINQNYDRHWRASQGTVVCDGGLLAVRLADTGRRELTLWYDLIPVRLAWCVPLATIAWIVVLFVIRWTCGVERRPALVAHRPATFVVDLHALWLRRRRVVLAAIALCLFGAWGLWHWCLDPIWTADALLDRAGQEIRMGRRGEAIAMLERRAEILPNDFYTLSVLGVQYLQQGQAKRAIAVLTRAVQLGPREAKSRRDLAAAYAAIGEEDHAISEAQAACALAPFDPNPRVEAARYLAQAGRMDAALECLERAAELGYDDVGTITLSRAFAALRQRPRFRRAVERIRQRHDVSRRMSNR